MKLPFADHEEEAEQVRQEAADLRLLSGIGRAGQAVNAALSGTKADPSAYDGIDAQASAVERRPAQELEANARIEALSQKAQAAQRLRDLDDPRSAASVQARELFRATTGSSIPDRMGATWDEMPASRIPGMKDLLKRDPEHLTKAQARLDADKSARDPQSEASKSARAEWSAAAEAALPPDSFKRWAQAAEGMTAETIEKKLWPLIGSEARRSDAKTSAAARAAQTQASRASKAEASEVKAETKAATAAKSFYVDGYELSPEARPSTREVEGLRDATAQTGAIKDTVAEIKRLYARYGSEALPTEARAEMGALARDLQLALKGPALYGLGVLTGPDLALLEEIAPSPTSANANVLSFFGSDTTLTKLDRLLKQTDSRLSNKARSLGYMPRGTGTPSAPKPSAPTPAKAGRVKVSNGKETLWIKPSALADAESEGFRRVE